MTRHEDDLVTVRLLGVPLALFARVQQAHEDLMREFALIALSNPGESVPTRLVTLTQDLSERYATFSEAAREQRTAAADRGRTDVDLVYRIPAAVLEDAALFDQLLDEAVEYCRNGDLLTLAPDAEQIAFRRWFLGEFRAQIRGRPPSPWSEHRARIS